MLKGSTTKIFGLYGDSSDPTLHEIAHTTHGVPGNKQVAHREARFFSQGQLERFDLVLVRDTAAKSKEILEAYAGHAVRYTVEDDGSVKVEAWHGTNKDPDLEKLAKDFSKVLKVTPKEEKAETGAKEPTKEPTKATTSASTAPAPAPSGKKPEEKASASTTSSGSAGSAKK